MEWIPTQKLRHIEGFSPKRVRWLRDKIVDMGRWTRPISVERRHLLVLDGQHRMEVALSLGLHHVPCELFDYKDVELWSLRSNHEVSRDLVVEKALAGDIYPYKTVKHRFPREIRDLSIDLDELYASRCSER